MANPPESQGGSPQDPSPGQGAEGDSVGACASKALKEPLLCILSFLFFGCAFLFNLTLMQSEGRKENITYLGTATCQHRRLINVSQLRILARTCRCLVLRGDSRFLCTHFSLREHNPIWKPKENTAFVH